MRIAINGWFWNHPHTGSGQYLRALLAALGQRDQENDYVLVVPENAVPQQALPARVSLHSAASAPKYLGRNLSKVWFEEFGFVKACRLAQADLAHIPYFASPLLPRMLTVVTVHDLIPMILPLYRGSILVRAYTRLVAAGARRANAVIADSECSGRDVVRLLGIPPQRVHIVRLGVDASYKPAPPEQIDAVRLKYALPEHFLLYLGGFDQRKNLRVIIQAFARLPDLMSSGYQLVLGGKVLGVDSAFFPDPRRVAREANLPDTAIRCIGWVDEQDKPALYSSAAVFLFPSLYEGFGLPPLEAMACGTPVLCANASSLPEVVGDAAVTIDPKDVGGWADAIRRVATNDQRRREMRERGFGQVAKFSWARAAEGTLAVYQAFK